VISSLLSAGMAQVSFLCVDVSSYGTLTIEPLLV